MLAILTWLALLLVDLIRVFGEINQMEDAIIPEITWILEIIFFILALRFF
jgi:phosphoserine phosphatase RsbU/P